MSGTGRTGPRDYDHKLGCKDAKDQSYLIYSAFRRKRINIIACADNVAIFTVIDVQMIKNIMKAALKQVSL